MRPKQRLSAPPRRHVGLLERLRGRELYLRSLKSRGDDRDLTITGNPGNVGLDHRQPLWSRKPPA